MDFVQPPDLAIDKSLARGKPVNLIRRQKIERAIVWNLIRHLAEHGFQVIGTFDGEEAEKTTDASEIMENVFNLDDCHVHFQKPGNRARWVWFVMGNDGPDVLCDYGCPIGDPDGFVAAVESFDCDACADWVS